MDTKSNKWGEASDKEDMLSPKKRKRIQTSPTHGSKVSATTVVSPKLDPYEAAVAFEEKEATSRTPEQDMKLFHKTCDTIRRILGQIEDLKRHPDKNRAQISELRSLAGLHVLALKKINRLEKVRLRVARDNTHAAKQRVDAFHLTLQNLLYEIVHVRREISRCLEFRSDDEKISLVSEEEFYRDAPEEISQSAVTRADTHRRHLARLDWELEQRRRLAESCQQRDADKRAISERIARQRRRLADLAPQLSTVLQSTRGLQEELALPLDRRREQHRLATLLPTPLYVLYAQTAAYAEACDSSMSSTICGNEEEAAALRQTDTRETAEDSESDQEPEEDAPRKKRHRKSGRDGQDQRVKKLLHKYPLLVVVELDTKEMGRLVLEFVYLTQLGIITVSVAIRDCPAAGPLLSAESLLDHLQPEDAGGGSPSPAASQRLRRAGLPPLSHYVTAGQLGRPYRWAQRLAGLMFTSPPPPADDTAQVAAAETASIELPAASEETSALCVHEIVRQIRARLSARVTLQTQITALAGGELPVPEPLGSGGRPRRDARLLSWRPVSGEMYAAAAPLPAPLVDATCTCYCATLSHPAGLQLHCYVALSPQHPLVAPLCGLVLNYGGRQLTARSPGLRVVEHELNVSVPSRLSPSGAGGRAAVLPAQLTAAADAADVLAHTLDAAPPAAHTLTLRKHRGRDRVPPLRYDAATNLFTHGAQ